MIVLDFFASNDIGSLPNSLTRSYEIPPPLSPATGKTGCENTFGLAARAVVRHRKYIRGLVRG